MNRARNNLLVLTVASLITSCGGEMPVYSGNKLTG